MEVAVAMLALNQMRLDRVDLQGDEHAPPGKLEQRTTAIYEEHLESWLPEANQVHARTSAFLTAADMLSRSFFSRKDVLFPDTRQNL